MQKNKYISLAMAVGLVASLAIALPVFAATNAQGGWTGSGGAGMPGGAASGGMHRGGATPGVFGTVSAVSGSTLTVTAKMRPNATSTPSTVYTVDASNAKIYKGSATSTVSISSIAVGDAVMVQGTVSGSNVTATVIRDGVGGMMGQPGSGMPGGKGFGGRGGASSTKPMPLTPVIQGNGEPVIGGNVTAISGTTLTVTNASNVTYTIDAGSSTIIKNGTSTTLSNIAVGDGVIVQGAVNGTSVTASSVIDQGVKGTNTSSTGESGSHGGGFGGIFSAIGGFFQHLFGF